MSIARNHVSAVLRVYDPRHWGNVLTEGARFDWSFWRPDEWTLDGVQLLPEIGAAMIEHYADPQDQLLAHWHRTGDDAVWRNVRPAPEERLWIEQVDAGAAGSYALSEASSLVRVGTDNGSVCVLLRATQPATSGWDLGDGDQPELLSGNTPHTYVEFSQWPITDLVPRYRVVFPEGSYGGAPLLAHYARWRAAGGGDTEVSVPRDSSDGSVLEYAGPHTGETEPESSDFAWRVVHRFDGVGYSDVWRSFSVIPIYRDGGTEADTVTGQLRRTDGVWVLFRWLGPAGEPSVLWLPQWPIGQPYVRIGGRGLSYAFCLGLPRYRTDVDCVARHRGTYRVPPDVTADSAEAVTADLPDGCTAELEIETCGADRIAVVTLRTTDENASPVCYRATSAHAPAFGDPVDTPVFDSSTPGGSRAVQTAEWEYGSEWRGGRATLTIRDRSSSIEFRPNQVVELTAQLTGDASMTSVWSGRIGRVSWQDLIEEGIVAGRLWTLDCADETMRMGHKRRAHLLGSMGGMRLHNALRWALQCAGVPDDRAVMFVGGSWVQIDDVPEGSTDLLPWSEQSAGDMRFAIGTQVTQVLDRLCELTGWTWGVNCGPGSAGGAMGLGDVCFWRRSGSRTWSLSSDATATYALTSAEATSEQHVMLHRQLTMDPDAWGNCVEVEGSDGRGVPVIGYARRESSDSSDPYYVGDRWSIAESAPDNQRPSQRAAELLGEAHQGVTVVAWSGFGTLAQRPDSLVAVEVAPGPTCVLARMTSVRHAIARRRLTSTYTAEVVPHVE